MPGKYAVKLTVDGTSYSQPLTVRMTRVSKRRKPICGNNLMETGIVEGMNETMKLFSKFRALRPQVTDRSGKAKGALADSLKAIDKEAGNLKAHRRARFSEFRRAAGSRKIFPRSISISASF